jgi:hypothetical protein
MWQRLQKNHPRLYEAIEWACFAASVAAFLLSAIIYVEVVLR